MTSGRFDKRDQLELLCADFDVAWRSGWRPRIEYFLAGLAGPRRLAHLAELLRVELRNRETLGEVPMQPEYAARFPDALEVVNAVFDGTRQPFVAATADSSEGFAGSRELDRGRFETSNLLPRRNSNEIRTASSISSAEIKPDACVSFFLGSRKNAATPSTTISLSHVGSPLLSNDEWGIERYTPIRKLGEGAFGAVYLAIDRELNRKVAVKLPKRPRLTSEQDATDFLVEARTLAAARPLGDRAGLRRRPRGRRALLCRIQICPRRGPR